MYKAEGCILKRSGTYGIKFSFSQILLLCLFGYLSDRKARAEEKRKEDMDRYNDEDDK